MSGIELAHVALATVGTIVMVGLGFLYRPDRATVLWSLAFIVSMLSAYAQMTAAAAGLDAVRLAAMGLGLGAPALVWAGLRVERGKSAVVGWLAVVVGGAAGVILPLAAPTEAYDWTFRLAYAVSAAFAGLTLAELLRRPERGGGTSFPLAMFSIVFVGVAAVSVVAGFFSPSLDLADDITMLGFLIYTVCALITLLFIVRGGAITRALAGGSGTPSVFRRIAADRLARAQTSGERSWTMLVVRLDDAADLRTATGEAGFAVLCARLQDDVREIFPTEADIGRLDASTFAVLLARPSAVVRENVRTLLRAVSSPGARGSDAVQASASVGWVSVAELGYDADVLLAAASDAAAAATAAGGDRWERVGVA